MALASTYSWTLVGHTVTIGAQTASPGNMRVSRCDSVSGHYLNVRKDNYMSDILAKAYYNSIASTGMKPKGWHSRRHQTRRGMSHRERERIISRKGK